MDLLCSEAAPRHLTYRQKETDSSQEGRNLNWVIRVVLERQHLPQSH